MITSIYAIISVIIVSLVSVVGVLALAFGEKKLHKILLILVSLSAGTLMGGAFLHLLPEVVEERGFTLAVSFSALGGVLVFFLIEKWIHAHHCEPMPHEQHSHLHHEPHLHIHQQHIGILTLFGDGLHNLLDGLVIAGAYLVSVPAGIATTLAVVLHEVPQEIADFGVLLYAGFSKWKALFYNFLSAATAILGAVIGLVLGARSEMFVLFILPFAAGGFVYIAGSILIPELHKECGWKESIYHVLAFIVGIALMWGILLLE
ncbi:MAG TPA: ZIP family metal transporter [Candidatus Nanoarchaeia archaeon]|nr:ZIP family metal transporter [Candidatus Nanoarchaeia archaeon]